MITLLLAIIIVMFVLIIILYRAVRYYADRTEEEIDKVKKGLEFYDILVHWIEQKQNKKNLAEYFIQNRYQTVAVYGMKEIGRLLVNELLQEGVDVRYAADRSADVIDMDEMSIDIPIIKPSSEMPEVDVIVVTASHYFDCIYLDLKELTKAEIVPVEDILWGI